MTSTEFWLIGLILFLALVLALLLECRWEQEDARRQALWDKPLTPSEKDRLQHTLHDRVAAELRHHQRNN